MNTPADQDPELRCAEYALGVLDADARRALEQSVGTDPALAATLARWQHRFSPLAEDIRSVEPPSRVWLRIERELDFLRPPSGRRGASASGWWNNLNLWRVIGVGASVAAFGLLAVNLAWLRGTATPSTVAAADSYMVATIARADGVAHWTATVDVRRAHMVVVPAAKLTIAANRSTELWLIPPNAKPIPLGVFTPNLPASMALPPNIVAQLSARAVLAVSIEPLGGSPTGLPTGPVVASGQMRGTV